jgi:hypothetical protein
MTDDDIRQGVHQAIEEAPSGALPSLQPVVRRARVLRRRRARTVTAGLLLLVAGVIAPLYQILPIQSTHRSTPSAKGTSILPDIALVTCEEDAIQMLTPTIRPQSDGVHFRVNNRTNTPLAFSVRYAGGGGGTHAPPGTSEPTSPESDASGWMIPPGLVEVTCRDLPGESTSPGHGASLNIIDEDGVWVSTKLDCAEVTGNTPDYGSEATAEFGSPVEIARRHFEGLQSTDRVESAGYPDERFPAVRVVRGGRVIAVAEFTPYDSGGWFLTKASFCSGAGLTG